MQCFCIDIPANKTAILLGMNRNTINPWDSLFCQAVYAHQYDIKKGWLVL